jgi:type I restriction-modification system DNA methylase subunit
MNYLKCPTCGITRNLDEAPDCPVCKITQLHRRDTALFSRKGKEAIEEDLESLEIRREIEVSKVIQTEERISRNVAIAKVKEAKVKQLNQQIREATPRLEELRKRARALIRELQQLL